MNANPITKPVNFVKPLHGLWGRDVCSGETCYCTSYHKCCAETKPKPRNSLCACPESARNFSWHFKEIFSPKVWPPDCAVLLVNAWRACFSSPLCIHLRACKPEPAPSSRRQLCVLISQPWIAWWKVTLWLSNSLNDSSESCRCMYTSGPHRQCLSILQPGREALSPFYRCGI